MLNISDVNISVSRVYQETLGCPHLTRRQKVQSSCTLMNDKINDFRIERSFVGLKPKSWDVESQMFLIQLEFWPCNKSSLKLYVEMIDGTSLFWL